MNVLLIDNYDSFTFNLAQALRRAGDIRLDIVKNDHLLPTDAERYDKILISPGPGIPSESAGICSIIREMSPRKPILGICLGHQAIGEVYGASLQRLPIPQHGQSQVIRIVENNHPLFAGLGASLQVGLYHSWALAPESIPPCLTVTAVAPDGVIMGISHRSLPVHGIQFHPESIMTPAGHAILKNWIERG